MCFPTLRYSFVNSVLWMLLFVFDHDCMERSVTYAYAVRTMLLWCPLLCLPRAAFAGRGWERWEARTRMDDRRRRIGMTWVGTRGKLKPWHYATHCHIFVGVLLVVEGRSSPGGHGGWHRNCIFSRPSLWQYTHILLMSIDPWKELVCGIACRQRRCQRIHWCVASHPHAVWLTQTVFSV